MPLKVMIRCTILLLAIVAMQACAVHKLSNLSPSAAEARLEPGDRVIVKLKDGKRYKAVVAAVDEKALVTKVRRYPWEEIAHVTIEEVNVASTVGSYVFLAALIAGIAYIAVAEAFED